MSPRSLIAGHLRRRLGLPQISTSLENLSRCGFDPKLIFDVGAYKGEFAMTCRRFWPDAQIACFEPLPHRAGDLNKSALKDANLRVFPLLMGAACRDAIMLHESETASSILTEHHSHSFSEKAYPMSTVDNIVSTAYHGAAPNLLKVDVQGYELEVLKGSTASLPGSGVVLLELNLLDIHVGVPLIAAVVGWLNDHGFVAYDLCGLTRRPLDRALWQIDMIFVPVDSPLRRDKRWC